MLMPDADPRPDQFLPSSHVHSAGTLGLRTLGTNAVPTCSAAEGNEPIDSPPHELLTELPVDGVDPPVASTHGKPGTPHGNLSALNQMGGIEAFPARPESPNRPQVPCDEPPGILRGPTEREAFKARYKEPAGVFLNYFRILEPVLDPPMPEPGTARPDWSK